MLEKEIDEGLDMRVKAAIVEIKTFDTAAALRADRDC